MGWEGIFAPVTALVGFLADWLLRALFPESKAAARGALFLVALLVAVAAGAAASLTLGPVLAIH